MLQGETLTYEKHVCRDPIPTNRVTTITNIDALNDAISGDCEITFEGGNQQKHLNFATLSDTAKIALSRLWKSPLAGVMHKKSEITAIYGKGVFDELDKLLRQ